MSYQHLSMGTGFTTGARGMLTGTLPGGGTLDWEGTGFASQVQAPSLPAFRFEPRRARMDWRVLHGVDVDSIQRDLDLDSLEQACGACIACMVLRAVHIGSSPPQLHHSSRAMWVCRW